MRRLPVFALIVTLIPALVQPCASLAADVVLPEGTRISLQLNDHLSTKWSHEGDPFTALVISPVYSGTRIVIPKGSTVSGSISRIIRPGRFKGKAGMYLLFQTINITGRGQIALVASPVRVNSQGEKDIRSEGRIEGEGSEGSDVGKVLAPAIVGAGIGTLAGGGKGAAIGGGAGIAIGLATVFTSRGKDLELRRGSTLDISLDRPLTVPSD